MSVKIGVNKQSLAFAEYNEIGDLVGGFAMELQQLMKKYDLESIENAKINIINGDINIENGIITFKKGL